MSRLTAITLQNFKVFKDATQFELAPFTILTGTNNSGKSSLLKALLLFKENLFKRGWEYLDFTKGNHKLGTYELTLNKDEDDSTMLVSLGLNFEDSFKKYGGVLVEMKPYFFSSELDATFFFDKASVDNGKIKFLILSSVEEKIFYVLPGNQKDNKTASVWIDWKWLLSRMRSKLNIYESQFINELAGEDENISFLKKMRKDVFLLEQLGGIAERELEPLFRLKKSILNPEVFAPDIFLEKELLAIENRLLEVMGIMHINKEESYPYLDYPKVHNYIETYFKASSISKREENKPFFNQEFYKILSEQEGFEESLEKISKSITVEEAVKPEFAFFHDLVKKGIEDVISTIENIQIERIPSTRAVSERIYGNDHPSNDFNALLTKIRNNPFFGSTQKFVNRWLTEFGFGEEFKVESIEGVASK